MATEDDKAKAKAADKAAETGKKADDGGKEPSVADQVKAARLEARKAAEEAAAAALAEVEKRHAAETEDLKKQIELERKAGYDDGANNARDELLAELGEANQGAAQSTPDWSRALLPVITRIPESMRHGGMRPVLQGLGSFISSFDDWADQVAAAEVIRAIAEVRPQDIVSGRYQREVSNAIAALYEAPEVNVVQDDRAQQEEAAERLRRLTGGSVTQSGYTKSPVAPTLDGTPEQNAAASRLYGA